MLYRIVRGRRGGGEYNVYWLIMLIALFLVVYIILLPVGEKEKLVGIPPVVGQPPGGLGPGGQVTSGLFLSESPGIVYPLANQVIARPLASVNLFSFTDVGGEGLASSVTVKKSAFSEQSKKLRFLARDLASIQAAQLLFLVKEGDGDLIILLNGEEIYRGQPTTEDLPLPLPQALLQQTNTLEFRVSGPGFNIFKTNTYVLKDVQVFFKNLIENRREERTFVLTRAERQYLRHATLYFIINCFTVQEQGRLVVYVNQKVVSDGLVVCDAGPIGVDLDPRDLIEGKNVIQFEIDQGKYVLEQIVFEKDVGQIDTPRYVFTVQVADLQAVAAGRPILLEMIFPPDGLRKIGAVYVNGFPVYVDTIEPRFVYEITGLVGPGTNIVRIVPAVPFEIASLNIGIA